MNMTMANAVYGAAGGPDGPGNGGTRGGVDATPPLVLLHGFPVDHRMWDACAARIREEADRMGLKPFAIYAPDVPGAGDSPVPAAREGGPARRDGSLPKALDRVADAHVELLHSLGHRRAVWAGLSMGGYVALAVQRLHPEAVAGLALCDTKPDADTDDSRARRLRIADACERENTVEPVMDFARPQAADSPFKRSQAYVDRFSRWIGEQRPDGIAWRERMAAGRPDQHDVLASIRVPVTLIAGTLDPFSPPERMRPMLAAMTGTDAAMAVVDGAGHFSAVERPDAVARALVALMRQVQSDATPMGRR